MNELLDVVEHLNGPSEGGALRSRCPWTAASDCRRVMNWLISEVKEVNEALDWVQLAKQSGEEEFAAAHLTSELGDVLFDTLMAIRLAQRDVPGVTLERAALAAATKIRRRTPYMPKWRQGDASASTEAEATVHWKAAKRREPEHRAPWRPKGHDRLGELRRSQCACAAFAVVAAAALAIRAYRRA